MRKINKIYPVNYKKVILSGIHILTNKNVKVIGYRIKQENRFITSPIGWSVNFTHYQEI